MVLNRPGASKERTILGVHVGPCACVVMVLLATALMPLSSAVAQRPFRFNDTLYRDEKAARSFFDTFAFTGEVLYRPERVPIGNGVSAVAEPIGYTLRLDYQLAKQFDLAIVFDAVGSLPTSFAVRWFSLKYYRTIDGANYAVRMALDPVPDGQGGFPQVDAALLYSSVVNQDVTSNIAFGIRRVRIGLEQLVEIPPPVPDPPFASGASTFAVEFTRALGWEVHGELRYSALVDPGGSNAFFAVLGEFGSYEIVKEIGNVAADATAPDSEAETDFRGGVVWFRSGLELSRPSVSLTPFISLPVGQWSPGTDQWPRSRLQLGLRLVLR